MNITSVGHSDIISKEEISRIVELQLKTRHYAATNHCRWLNGSILSRFGVCLLLVNDRP